MEAKNIRALSTRTIRNISFVLLTVLLVATGTLAFMTHNATTGGNSYWAYAVEHHTEIMAALVVVSLASGFVTSHFLYGEVQRKRRDSRDILGVVLLFLSTEEREIVHYLVQQKGETTQAEIARLPHMNRVKAHRSLQKMQDKQLLDIIPHGKIRRVRLKENILSMLQEPQK